MADKEVNPRVITTDDVKNWVLRQLGYPTRNVELDMDQLSDCIDFALREIQPWFTTQYYLTIDVTSSAIDLSEYNVFEVSDVIKIPVGVTKEGSATSDPFSYNPYATGFMSSGGVGGIWTNSYISQLTNSDIHHVVSAYARQYNEMFYSKLAYMLAQRTMGSIKPNINWTFSRQDSTLYIDPGYPYCKLVTIEYIPYLKTVEQLKDNRYIRIVQDLSLGQAMILLSRIIGKYDVNNAPAKINHERFRDEGEKLIEYSRSELQRITRNHFILD